MATADRVTFGLLQAVRFNPERIAETLPCRAALLRGRGLVVGTASVTTPCGARFDYSTIVWNDGTVTMAPDITLEKSTLDVG